MNVAARVRVTVTYMAYCISLHVLALLGGDVIRVAELILARLMTAEGRLNLHRSLLLLL